MTRTARNTVSVLFATAVATLAIFASVQYGIGSLAPEAATAASLTCPATGCTASSCHATTGGGGGWGGGRGYSFPG
jgi:hypothetical protein